MKREKDWKEVGFCKWCDRPVYEDDRGELRASCCIHPCQSDVRKMVVWK